MQSALEAVHEYYSAFSTLDLNAIASCYCEPCMWITPQGMFSAANRAALLGALGSIIEGLKAKGYGRSEFAEPQAAMLSETAALVRGVAVRYAAAGPELERIPISYLMHRTSAGWKIAVLVLAG
jgi:ketosteroid isomerase-like protein